MRLFSLLIKRELAENLTSSRYVLTSILCVVLCVTSIVLMSQDDANRIKRYNLSHNVQGKQNILDWGVAAIIAKPPMPLSLIAKGTEEVIGQPALPQGPWEGIIVHFYNYFGEEHHLFDLFATPDFVYVVSIVLSAFAIFLSFDAICGEKETHTLSLLLSYPLPRAILLMAKWMSGYASLLVSLVPALLLMVIYLAVFSGVPLSAEHWIRLAGLIVLSFVYLSAFFTFGLFISTLTRRSATALILVLVCWATWALGVPRAGILAGRAMKPIPPESIFRMEKGRVRDTSNLSEELVQERLWKMNDARIAEIDGQIALGQHLSRFSPLASYLYASTTLAQTGLEDYKDYRTKLSHWNRQRLREGSSSDFVYQPLTLGKSLSEMGVDLALLIVWNIVLFLWANMAFLRYDVR